MHYAKLKLRYQFFFFSFSYPLLRFTIVLKITLLFFLVFISFTVDDWQKHQFRDVNFFFLSKKKSSHERRDRLHIVFLFSISKIFMYNIDIMHAFPRSLYKQWIRNELTRDSYNVGTFMLSSLTYDSN